MWTTFCHWMLDGINLAKSIEHSVLVIKKQTCNFGKTFAKKRAPFEISAGSNFQDPGITRKNGEIGKFLRLARHRKIGFSMDPGLKVGSIATRGGGQAARRDFKEVPQIARRSLLWKTTLLLACFLHHLGSHHRRGKTFSYCCAPLPSPLRFRIHARENDADGARIISGQLHDFPE